MTRLVMALCDEAKTLWGFIVALGQDLVEVRVTGPRSRQCFAAALSVALSTTAALWLHLDNVWWAAISGFVSSQATLPASVEKAALRVIGTAAGASIAFFMAPWLVYDQVACCLFLMLVTSVGVLGVQVSPHGYAWLFAAITIDLILLMSLNAPLSTLSLAVYRAAEVMIGSLAGVLAASILTPAEAGAHAAPPPGWTDLLGARWPAVLHAVRSGITVSLIPLAWNWLELTDVSQMAVTVAVVMAVPILSDHPVDEGRVIVTRAVHRLLGCFFGGMAALACLAIPLTEFLPWIFALSLGVYVATYVQASERGIGYIGTQAAMVFIITLVQGFGPPSSVWPGVDRFGGMMGGLLMLFAVSLLLWPSNQADPARETVRSD